MAKRYSRVNWEDSPSTKSPRNAYNLNRLDKGIDDNDNAIETIQAQINVLVVDGDSSVEAAQARVNADGTTFVSLKQRLDSTEIKVAADYPTSPFANQLFYKII